MTTRRPAAALFDILEQMPRVRFKTQPAAQCLAWEAR